MVTNTFYDQQRINKYKITTQTNVKHNEENLILVAIHLRIGMYIKNLYRNSTEYMHLDIIKAYNNYNNKMLIAN